MNDIILQVRLAPLDQQGLRGEMGVMDVTVVVTIQYRTHQHAQVCQIFVITYPDNYPKLCPK